MADVVASRTIAERFFAALAAGDADAALACCAADCTFERNDVRRVQLMHDELASLLPMLRTSGTSIRYDDPVHHATAAGFVEEHTVVLTVGASTVSLRTVVVAEVGGDGLITAMREYLDPTPLSRLAAR